MKDINLDDKSSFTRIHYFEIEEAFTYGNSDKVSLNWDLRKRERLRMAALQPQFYFQIPNRDNYDWWAFRIIVKKTGNTGKKRFDIENVPKLIIDAFCHDQIIKDQRKLTTPVAFENVWFYEDDNIKNVRYFEIYGEPSEKDNSIAVEIYGKKKNKK